MSQSRDFFTLDQQRDIQLFQDITQITDDEVCIQILVENSWNVDIAVDVFMQQQSGSQPFQTPAITSSRNRNINNVQNRTSSTEQARSTPLRESSQSSNLFLAPLRWLFQTHPVSLNRELDTRKFLGEFDLKYSAQHPNFVEGSYKEAVALAFQQSKFLLVYLHSPMHEDTSKFCNQVLCSETFSQFANQNIVCWAGRVWDPEAYDLSSQLRASSYPFLALLICQSDRVVQIADRVQGFVEERVLQERLRNGMAIHSEVLTRTRTEANRREESTNLRQQQDREYQESADADRRDRERREEEAIERIRVAEEEKEREQLSEAVDLSVRLTRESDLKKKKETLPSEPEASSDVAAVRFQLPQGAKLARRFHKDHTVQMIYDFLTIHFDANGINVTNFVVSTTFPKADLHDMTATVHNLGLHPRGMLYIQDLDS
jgi:FAS-associated factor 2